MVYLHLLTNTVHFIDVKKADSITLGKNQLSSLFKLAQAFPDQWIGWSTAENPIWKNLPRKRKTTTPCSVLVLLQLSSVVLSIT